MSPGSASSALSVGTQHYPAVLERLVPRSRPAPPSLRLGDGYNQPHRSTITYKQSSYRSAAATLRLRETL